MTTKLNAAEALDSFRTGWYVVGELPELNAYQVEWTYSGTPTTTDLENLLDDIEAQGGVMYASAELEGTGSALAVPSDFDLYAEAEQSGVLAQINFEEARRLYWLSGLNGLSQVDIYVPDSGLMFGSAAWAGSRDELPDDRFALYELGSAGWASTAATGHYVYHPDYDHDHGTSIAGLIGASSQRDPDWSDGGARDTGDPNASGILSSFSRPRGVAITPMLSIASPRPGVEIAGIKRFHVIVRDPSITEIVYEVDGSTECTDDELWDGSSEDCEIDTSAWTTGDHVVTVVATGGTNGDFFMSATYSTYLL